MTRVDQYGQTEKSAELAEEREFFMTNFGWDDRQVAAKLGWNWETYRVYFNRHPELGPIVDRQEEERLRWSAFASALRKRRD